jgi:threonylcarbamoyladenosine tRNA methylthiotransferase MtaB
LIREAVPDVAITTDVIAGFPGETDGDFEATYGLCEELQFGQMHCFPYSRRPQTGAAKMDGHVPPDIRRGRLERLLGLADRLTAEFRRSFAGRTMDVLWETRLNGVWEGLTGNYLRVYACAEDDIENQLLPVRLEELSGDGVRGVFVRGPAV